MNKLILVRHGLTVDNEHKSFSGFSDCDLSQIGRAQAKGLCEYLKSCDVDKIYTSTLKRTVQTIEAYADYKGLGIDERDGFREINFGLFDGLNYQEIKEKYPKETEEMMVLSKDYKFPQGESLDEMYQRNAKELDMVIEENKGNDKNILICSHMGTIRNILSHLLTKNGDIHWNFRLQNASVTVIDMSSGFPIIELMGFIPYSQDLVRDPYRS